MKSLEERIKRIELFLQTFCALQAIHQGILPATPDEQDSIEVLVADILEQWKSELD